MYTLSKSGVLKKDDEIIPMDDSTLAYQTYVEWLSQGNGPELIEDSTLEYHRIQVTAWQLLQALDANGLLATVDSAVASSTDALIRLGWGRAPFFYSDQPFVIALASAIRVSRDQLQRLFEQAATF